MGGAGSARRVAGTIPVGLVLSVLAGGCAHSTLPKCPAPEAADAAPGPNRTYFQGVKARVWKTWDPNRALKAQDPEGKQFGVRDRYVILDVTLDAAGAISTIKLRRSSGLPFLDEAAMEAFRRAAPFGPPPPGLRCADGTVAFPFGFYMEAPAQPAQPAR